MSATTHIMITAINVLGRELCDLRLRQIARYLSKAMYVNVSTDTYTETFWNTNEEYYNKYSTLNLQTAVLC